jgi:hypothetical protein
MATLILPMLSSPMKHVVMAFYSRYKELGTTFFRIYDTRFPTPSFIPHFNLFPHDLNLFPRHLKLSPTY